MVAIVEPLPPAHLVAIRREQVLNFLQEDLQVIILSAQTWFQGVGSFEVASPVMRSWFTRHPPFPMGLDEDGHEFFVCFIPHNQGEGFRAIMDTERVV